MALSKIANKYISTNSNKQPINNLCSVAKDCNDCSLGYGATVAPSGPDSIEKTKLILIGEKPGNKEVLTGYHFVGELSRIARVLVRQILGLKTRVPDRNGNIDLSEEEEVIYTNAVLCKPKKDTAITKAQYTACSKYNNEILSRTNCPVLLCGLGAIHTYLPDSDKVSLKDVRGKVHRINGRDWICTFNPAVVQRGIFYIEGTKKPDTCFDSLVWHFTRDLLFVKSVLH